MKNILLAFIITFSLNALAIDPSDVCNLSADQLIDRITAGSKPSLPAVTPKIGVGIKGDKPNMALVQKDETVSVRMANGEVATGRITGFNKDGQALVAVTTKEGPRVVPAAKEELGLSLHPDLLDKNGNLVRNTEVQFADEHGKLVKGKFQGIDEKSGLAIITTKDNAKPVQRTSLRNLMAVPKTQIVPQTPVQPGYVYSNDHSPVKDGDLVEYTVNGQRKVGRILFSRGDGEILIDKLKGPADSGHPVMAESVVPSTAKMRRVEEAPVPPPKPKEVKNIEPVAPVAKPEAKVVTEKNIYHDPFSKEVHVQQVSPAANRSYSFSGGEEGSLSGQLSSGRVAATTNMGAGMKYKVDNQDAFSVTQASENEVDLLVADGVGGHGGGALASQTAVKTVEKGLQSKKSLVSSMRDIPRELEKAHQTSPKPDQVENMATTVSGVQILKKQRKLIVSHLGDSPVSIHRKGMQELETVDHVTGPEYPKRFQGKLTKYYGIHFGEQVPDMEPQIETFDLQPGDQILLTSDGIRKTLSGKQINTVMNNNNLAPEQKVSILTRMYHGAIQSEGQDDNVTVIVYEFLPKK